VKKTKEVRQKGNKQKSPVGKKEQVATVRRNRK